MLAYRYPSCLTLKHLRSDFLTNSFSYWNRWLAALAIPINWSDEHELILAAAKGLNNTEKALAVAIESQQCAPVAGTMASLGTPASLAKWSQMSPFFQIVNKQVGQDSHHWTLD